ncbi:hypothetical protein ATE84_5170 [Aquimarina sp. MAR_2010_214]|nr:hypothetical protein ATE84_5170 [Aquimarina sp. MAR_2010_214]
MRGSKLIKKVVINKEEEHAFVKSLTKGFYSIKNNKETYKVIKN